MLKYRICLLYWYCEVFWLYCNDSSYYIILRDLFLFYQKHYRLYNYRLWNDVIYYSLLRNDISWSVIDYYVTQKCWLKLKANCSLCRCRLWWPVDTLAYYFVPVWWKILLLSLDDEHSISFFIWQYLRLSYSLIHSVTISLFLLLMILLPSHLLAGIPFDPSFLGCCYLLILMKFVVLNSTIRLWRSDGIWPAV